MSRPASPNDIIKQSPMSWYQYAVIAICVLTYAADGVDVVTLAYAAPVMMREWGISASAFGLAYSATPVGIALGSIFISPVADKIGRRTLMVWLLGLLVVLLLLTAFTSSVLMLMALRLVTGACLGALVVCLNVAVSEFSNEKRSNVLIGVLHTGYSLGGMLCGALAALLIEPYGWRSIFLAAALLNAVSFLLCVIFLAESPTFLVTRRRPDALARLNAVFRRMNKPEFESLPPPPPLKERTRGGLGIIPREFWFGTAMLCLAGFMFTVSGGFMSGWRPKILESAGLNMTWNGIAGVASSGAGVVAHLVVGALARRVGERKIAAIFLLATGAAMVVLGLVPDGAVWPLIAASMLSGFFNVGSYTALVLVTLNYYDVSVRNAGLGIMMGFSRVGGILGPLLGGFVIGAGLERFWVLLIFGAILIIPAATAIFARARSAQVVPAHA